MASLTTFALMGGRAQEPGSLAHGIEYRSYALDRMGIAGRKDVKSAGGGGVWTAHHGSGDVPNSGIGMQLLKLEGKRHRKCAHDDMNHIGRGRLQQALIKYGRTYGIIIRQHRDHGIGADDVADIIRSACA
jgi:hypothetical protein